SHVKEFIRVILVVVRELRVNSVIQETKFESDFERLCSCCSQIRVDQRIRHTRYRISSERNSKSVSRVGDIWIDFVTHLRETCAELTECKPGDVGEFREHE